MYKKAPVKSLRILRGDAANKGSEFPWVSGLHEDGARTGKLAHKAFARREARDDASRRDTLQDVACVPRHKVAIVHDVLFALRKLLFQVKISSR